MTTQKKRRGAPGGITRFKAEETGGGTRLGWKIQGEMTWIEGRSNWRSINPNKSNRRPQDTQSEWGGGTRSRKTENC